MGEKGTLYNEILNEELATALVYPGSLQFYRSLLYQQPDHSVTICGIGTLTALAQLLNSPADSICSLSGEELIKQKVIQLVCMASVNYPHGRDGFNLRMDIPSSYRVITDWPTPVAFQASGSKVMTGSHSMRILEEHHPLRRAYEIWLQDPAANRCSWDQLTVLYAVLGTMDLFSEMTGKGLHYNPNDGVNSWVDSPSRFPRTLVQIDVDPDQAASIVEDWMIGSD
jgi:hypothetical protein